MKIKRSVSVSLILLIILSMSLGMTGCRESHVLEQVVYTEDQQIDFENHKIENDEDNTDEDEELSARAQRDDSQKERNQQNTQAVRGDGNSKDTTAKLKYDQDSLQSGETTGAGNGNNPSEQTDSAGVNDITGIDVGTDNTPRQIVDVNGQTVEIPHNVATVTAVGETAVLVEMLGGNGRLLASSESFTTNPWCKAIFETDMGNVQTLWPGRGRDAISNEGFQALLAAKPTVCLVNSGDITFSDEQLIQLSEAGIITVTIQKLNNLENLEAAVRLLGEILGDQSGSGGKNAPAVAQDYCKWAEGIINKVNNSVDAFRYNNIDFSKDRYASRNYEYKDTETDAGLYTLFIGAWDGAASYRLYSGVHQTMAGNGVAIAPSGYSTTPLSYYLSEAGVVNRAAVASDNFRLRNWYVRTLNPSTRILEISGSVGTDTNQFLTKITDPSTSADIYLGEPRFPALIAADNAVRGAIEQDRASGGMWKDFPRVSAGQVSGYGFLEEQGQLVSTMIHGPYQIYVLPAGAGSWNYASAEGVLTSMWAAMKFQGAFSEDDLRNEIANFYSSFYGYTLSAEQIGWILAGG